MATVTTVLGPVDVRELGFTLMHEHILVANWAMRQSFAEWVNRDAVVEKAVTQTRAAKALGVGAMVDLTPINLGRDIGIIREVSERAEMHIIAATGFYWNEEPWMEGWSPDQLADWLQRDIERGIQGTGCKAGIIKCASDKPGVTHGNKRLLLAAAKLHKRTGLPISTHTSATNTTALEQVEIFQSEGVDMTRVVIGHAGDSTNVEYLGKVLSSGCYIGMDRFGLMQLLPTPQRVNTIAALCKNGFANRMVLSHDACCRIDWYPQDVTQLLPHWNYSYIAREVLPALKKEGVTDEHIRQMTVENPRKIFGG